MPILDWIAARQEIFSIVGLLLTAGIILLWRGWRITLFSLLGQYLLLGSALALVVPQGVALVKPLVGLLVFLILYPAGFRLPQERLPTVTPWPFRAAMLLLAGIGGYGLAFRFSWPDLPQTLAYGSWWLILMGLFTAFLAGDPFRAGLGLLVLQSGFEVTFTVLEPGLLVAGFLGVYQILLALATSYLTTARSAALPTEPSPTLRGESD
ncbi:MAG: hypothetical protein HYX86_05475 [Chloroflexi bacterium]|nr:hypothetical protein [Chloroflexota bacterium]